MASRIDPLITRFEETIARLADAPEEEMMAAAMLSPAIHFALFCQIRDDNNNVIDPTPNILQLRMCEVFETLRDLGVRVRIIVTKPRRAGCSSFVEHIGYHTAMQTPIEGITIADDSDGSDAAMKKLTSFALFDRFPWGVQMVKDATKSVAWDNGSKWTVDTARNPNAGAGDTRQFGHMSETSKWPRTTAINDVKTMTCVMPSLSGSDSVVFSESTPEGAAGWQYKTWSEDSMTLQDFLARWDQGFRPEEIWIKVFAAWFEFPSNRRKTPCSPEEIAELDETLSAHEAHEKKKYDLDYEQLAWRRDTIKSKCHGDPKVFSYYYPSDDVSCLSANNRIPTTRGLIPINQVVPGDVLCNGSAINAFSQGVKRIGELTTKRGYRVECTSDHRIALASGGYVEAGKSAGQRIKLSKPIFSERPHIERWNGIGGSQTTMEITEQWGRFLGYYCGDGSLYKNQLSMISDERDKDVVCVIENDWQELLGKTPTRRQTPRSKSIELRGADQSITDLFERMGLLEDGPCGRKRKIAVPECIWRSPKPVVAAFLNALYEADGHTRRTGRFVQFHSKHKQFCQEIIYLLFGFGIYGKLYSVVAKLNGKEHPGWCIRISAGYVDRFYAEIGFLGRRKQSFSTANENSKGNGRKPEILDDTDEVESFIDLGTTVEVFDITMSDVPEFCSGGVVVHNCWLASGSPRFDMQAVVAMEIAAKTQMPSTGYLITQDNKKTVFQSQRDDSGDIFVWEPPKAGLNYLVCLDPATNASQTVSKDPDRHSLSVWRRGYHDQLSDRWMPAKRVARLRPPFCGEDEEVAAHAARLSRFYGRAMVAMEINVGQGIMRLLQVAGIPLYKRKVWSARVSSNVEQYGFKMSSEKDVREALISGLASAIQNGDIDPSCPHAVAEYKAFIINGKGKSEASSGHHDDDCMADAIAWECLPSATPFRLETAIHRGPPDQGRHGWRDSVRKW